jgi:hypothetical protein
MAEVSVRITTAAKKKPTVPCLVSIMVLATAICSGYQSTWGQTGETEVGTIFTNAKLGSPPIADPFKAARNPGKNDDPPAEGRNIKKNGTDKNKLLDDVADVDSVQEPKPEGFHWRPALIQSEIFLAIQHGFRMTEKKTTKELGGRFFGDWFRSVQNVRGWSDGGRDLTNYLAHPSQGAFTGRIFVNNSDRAKRQVFGSSKAYWNSRLKALAWSAFWSTQFELGPLSEASLGNVGMRKKTGFSTAAYVDLVITPTVGTGLLIAEDAIDKYIFKDWLERRSRGKAMIAVKVLRSVMTPTTTLANLIRLQVPWKRDNRVK